VGHLRASLKGISKHAATDIDVINAGIRGYTNYQQILYLKKFGLGFQPDAVGIQFCLNDLHKFLHSFRVENDKIVPGTYVFSTEALSESRTWRAWWNHQSYLLNTMDAVIRVAFNALMWKTSGGFSFDYTVDFGNAWQDEPWSDIDKQLEEFVRLGERHYFQPFIVVFPIAQQYNSEYLERDRDYVLKPQRKLHEIADRWGIPFCDLYRELDVRSFSDGLHLTKEGRELAGKRIAECLLNSGLLPDRRRSSEKNDSKRIGFLPATKVLYNASPLE
jgi:lysophospholipase L1-like esterase